jgi:FtsH-binding integral membrane protein
LIFGILTVGLTIVSVVAIGMAEHAYDIDLQWLRYLIVAAITAGCIYYGTRSSTPSE